MSCFTNLRQTLGNYMSPATKVEKRSSIPSRNTWQLDHQITNPKRTVQWLENSTTETSTKKILGVKGSKIIKSFTVQKAKPTKPIIKSSTLQTSKSSQRESTSPSSQVLNKFSGTRAKSRRIFWVLQYLSNLFNKEDQDDTEDEIEGSTIIEDAHQVRSPSVENDTTLHDDSDEGINEILTAEDADENEYEWWTKEEIWLFEKLQDRGLEPLLHVTWGFDFPTLPVELFTTDHSKVFIKSIHDNDYHGIFTLRPICGRICIEKMLTFYLAQKALEGLHFLGSRVRDRVTRRLPPEPTIRRQFEAYYKWSIHDAGLTNVEHIPVLTITSAAPKESIASLVSRATDRLLHMGREYRLLWLDKEKSKNGKENYTHAMPTLYGIAIKYTVVAFLTHDVTKPHQAVRSLAVFDMQQKGQDVWNGLAVAILFVRARNYLLKLRAEGHLGRHIVREADDPDA